MRSKESGCEVVLPGRQRIYFHAMGRKWFLAGVALYVLVAAVLFPFVLHIPVDLTFGSDAVGYSRTAINLLKRGFLTLDGVHPFLDREPGQSVFLALVYALFGVENPVGLYLSQGLLLLAAAAVFCREIAPLTSRRASGIFFVLLLTSGSVLHAVFSAYRESLALSLLLLFTTLFLSASRCPSWWKTAGMGVLLAGVILTYYSFVLFPLALILLALIERRPAQRGSPSRRPLKPVFATVLLCYALIAAWGLRNFSYDGRFRVIADRRTAVMWYVRGEQAENIRGLEPLKCLWSEYISRNWTGRSPACSYNALMHQRWPEGSETQTDSGDVIRTGQAKIRSHFLSYLWFSVFEVLELHFPYVGGGWSTAFNVYAALTAFVLYAGFLLGLRRLLRRGTLLFLLLILYNTGVFVLTDATPRYLVPVLFCYALFAAIGYDAALSPRRP